MLAKAIELASGYKVFKDFLRNIRLHSEYTDKHSTWTIRMPNLYNQMFEYVPYFALT